jgi:fructose-specific phosphotransferase system IIC component
MRLFVLLTSAGGAGGVIGSIIGAAAGKRALFIGGFLGGLIAAPAAAYLASRLHWIEPREVKGTALGAALGFLTAATVAVNTLSSPVGPVLSTLLIGAGGLVGRHLSITQDDDG